MARRKQLKGVAGNLAQWCMSRNFDYRGYWAVGHLYAFTEEMGSNQFVIVLVNDGCVLKNEADDEKFSESINLLLDIFLNETTALNIPSSWIKNVRVVFNFNAIYDTKYHMYRPKFGGNPTTCLAEITTDLGKVYTYETGGYVWCHDPRKEYRRYGYGTLT